jgi:hypothetical protein
MSGVAFDYKQYTLYEIADEIDRIVSRQSKRKNNEELSRSDDYYEKYPEELINPTYSRKVQLELNKTILILKTTYVYVQRVDWLLSGDDSEDTFLERLKDDLSKVSKLKFNIIENDK